MIVCAHAQAKKHGHDRYGNQRYRCHLCGATFIEPAHKPLGEMRLPLDDARLVLRLLVEGMSIRSAERTSGINRNTICKLLVVFGDACRKFLDHRMRNLSLTHLQFDEQWTYVAKKQNRLTLLERSRRHDIGDVYLWTCIDQKTKLMPSFLIGKRSADNCRRFMVDVAGRLVKPDTRPHLTDAHAYRPEGHHSVIQISGDAFAPYREAVDLAFGSFVKFGTIIKEYRNAKMIYTPSEMVGTKRKGIIGIGERGLRTICTSHVERLNGTQRLFMKRLNRLTYAFSKKLRNLEAAFGMFAAYYNFCWQTRKPGKSGQKRPTAAMMAGVDGHVWSFEELFDAVLSR